MPMQLDLAKLYGFKIVTGKDGKLAGQTTSSKIGHKDDAKNGARTASRLGGKIGDKAGHKS